MTTRSESSTETGSARELVLARREGFIEGARWYEGFVPSSYRPNPGDRAEVAAEHFPLPPIVRPRVVSDAHADRFTQVWRCVDGLIQWALPSDNAADKWQPLIESGNHKGTIRETTVARIRLWADLLANPLETIADDSVAAVSDQTSEGRNG